ncbi:MAG: carbohydrate porin [Planctomycetota bacterium]
MLPPFPPQHPCAFPEAAPKRLRGTPPPRLRAVILTLAACLTVFAARLVAADAPLPASPPAAPPPAAPAAAPDDPPPATETATNLFGNLGGLRPWLANRGVSFNLTEIDELWSNLSGGTRRGGDFDGLTTLTVDLDADQAFHWPGATFHLSALQIHGRSITADDLATLYAVSNIEADGATRLWELWFQQSFAADRADLKLGLQSVDQEFLVSEYSSLFLGAQFGWPVVPSDALYGGGPIYPLASLGARLQLHPADPLCLLLGAFDDNPAGGPFDDDSALHGAEDSGLRFNLNTGTLYIAELQFAINQPPADADSSAAAGAGAAGLPGAYKLGVWYDTAGFPDQRFDTLGRSLADPASNGVARTHRGDFSLYALADQTVWQAAAGPRSLAVFARLMGAPADRNPVDWCADFGLNLKAPFAARPNDSLGLGCGLAHISPRAAALDRDTARFSGAFYPVRRLEQSFEFTYQCQAAWLLIQPDLQYVLRPGGGLPDPIHSTRRIGDEFILGARTVVTF